MRDFFVKITVLFIVILFISSCNAVKRVKDDQYLLSKNNILVNGEKIKDEEVAGLLSQRPNNMGRLALYNLARENPDSFYVAKLDTALKDINLFERIISKKQLVQVADYKINFNNWLMKTGEAPVIIDENKTKKSAERLELYYDTKGYFNNIVEYEVDTTGQKEKRAVVNYRLKTGPAYYIDSISTAIPSKDLDSIYERYKRFSRIRPGQRFDLDNFQAEKERLTTIFSNNGIYKFQPNSISFDIQRDTTLGKDQKMPVQVDIDNVPERDGDSLDEVAYKVHRIKNVNIFADYSFNDDISSLQSIQYDGYNIYFKDKLKYRPKALTDAIAILPGNVYKDSERSLTARQISNLKVFKYPNINYVYVDSTDNQLNTNIYLAPRPRFSLSFSSDVIHSNIQDIGISPSISLISRNIFRGAETLDIAFRGTFGSSSDFDGQDSGFFNIAEFGADVGLNFPRIFFPFNTDKYIPKSMAPETRFSVGATLQKNIGLDKQTLNGILRYKWNPNTKRKNFLELINVQYVKNLNTDRYYDVYDNSYEDLNDVGTKYAGQADPAYYDENGNLIIPEGTTGFTNDVLDGNISTSTDDRNEVSRVEDQRERLTANNLIFASNYTYFINNRRNFNDNNFFQFRGKIEFAGNLLSAMAPILNFDKNENGDNLIFGVQYSQYVKTELDYIKYWRLSRSNVLAFRSFVGMAIPYGNADNIPFIRSYFAGGSNDNRAWQPYSLGPGRTDNINDFNEANLKLAFNLEYRFNLIGDFKGALFADAGNIWNFLDDVDDEAAVFEGISSLSEIALGTGFGIRYDFNFFVLRFDIGFKTYDPSYQKSKRWFTDYNFGNAVYNIGINYPF
ncbi:BamA/TamA family outer membrane protein [Galbibacter pacificus]|uniref:BamA/TamA family outer membrane protein n=1 Tax=Galbibacter pacificus TaxID=2996052 RepID=A0ABT6FLU6_9FLAO|nr:BamA/TamA family outer membrane protein [Galbibacter pacificus]MDG3580757.1 BamA/TamA family outer membrane protein [Galbibacter pacificus]MDG3584235.1 BamA/TamA family outer membrane protein [Galbibacter pacificus]